MFAERGSLRLVGIMGLHVSGGTPMKTLFFWLIAVPVPVILSVYLLGLMG